MTDTTTLPPQDTAPAEPEYYVIKNGPPPPWKGLASIIENLQDGQSFVVPSAGERMRALALAKARKIPLISRKVKEGAGSGGYRIWRASQIDTQLPK